MKRKNVGGWKGKFASLVVPMLALLGGVFVGGKIAQAAATTHDGITLNRPNYDYAPSVMNDSDGLKMWWCGTVTGGDQIYYSKWNGSSWSTPQVVLTKSSSGWDSFHTCDPSVVKGSFSYGGTSYAYAMYYSATDLPDANTRVGVAFSNNGINWVKYPYAIVTPGGAVAGQYGAGMQTAYRENGTNSSVYLAYYDSTLGDPNYGTNHFMHSTDGIHFFNRTPLPNPLFWEQIGDIAYNPSEGVWYITTKHANDEIVYLYKTTTAALTSQWIAQGQVTSQLTGQTRNHNPGWRRKVNGDIYIQPITGYKYVYYGSGTTDPATWELRVSRLLDGWEFNSNGNKEGWTGYNITSSSSAPYNGAWIFSGAADPHVDSQNLLLLAADFPKVVVNMANNSSDPNARIYFRTSTENYYSDDKSVAFTVSTNGSWSTYTVNMGVNSKWTGYVTGLRLDPTGNGNGQSIGIDYIRSAK